MNHKSTIALALTLAGCSAQAINGSATAKDVETRHESGGTEAPHNAVATADPVRDVDENLARLAALDVFEVGQLIVEEPASASNCYGPCEGYEEDLAKAEAAAAARLAKFTDRAVKAEAAGESEVDPDADLAALRALEVVEIGALLHAEPKNNKQCYHLPCAWDIAAAEAVNEQRLERLAAIVKATEGI